MIKKYYNINEPSVYKCKRNHTIKKCRALSGHKKESVYEP